MADSGCSHRILEIPESVSTGPGFTALPSRDVSFLGFANRKENYNTVATAAVILAELACLQFTANIVKKEFNMSESKETDVALSDGPVRTPDSANLASEKPSGPRSTNRL
jgi:hypothetical protein